MANFTALKTAINNAIKTNGNEEITGAVLQVILDAMVETLGESAITNLENALSDEITNRQNAVSGVADDLAAEALARAAKDNQLDGRINQEEYNRQNADAALSQTMSQGFQTLGSQMTALNAAISALNAAYQNGYLYGGIATPSSSPSNNKCFYIALQGGTYTNFGGVGVVEGINIIKNDSGWKVEHIYDQTTLLNEFYLLRQQVIQAITSFAPIVIEGDVTNAPDEEDLTSNANHLLQFKNNAYSPLEFSGLGRKYLRKNIAPLSESAPFNGFVEGVNAEDTLSGTPTQIFWDRMNTRFVGIKDGVYYLDWTGSDNYVPASTSLVYMYNGTPYQWTGSDFIVDETEVPNLVNCLTQDMINEANTIYIIRYDYTLKEDITIPANCVLEFDGGSISGSYTLTGNNTCINAGLVKIFDTDITLDGTWNVSEVYPEWFGAVGDGVTDDGPSFVALSYFIQDTNVNCISLRSNAVYRKLTNSANWFNKAIVINGNGAIIDAHDATGGWAQIRVAVGYDRRNNLTTDNKWADKLSCVLSNDYSKGYNVIQVDDSSELAAGDYILIRNSTNGSFSPERDIYRNSEIKQIRSINNNDVTFVEQLYADYPAATTEFYKLSFCEGLIIRDLTIIQAGDVGISILGCKASCIENVTVKLGGGNGENIGILVAGCIETTISNININLQKESDDTGYGISISDSQNIIVKDSFIRSGAHAITVGMGGAPVGVIDRFININKCNLQRVTAGASLNTHSCVEYVSITDNFIKGGTNLCGNHLLIQCNEIAGFANNNTASGYYAILKVTELVGFDVVITNNNIYGYDTYGASGTVTATGIWLSFSNKSNPDKDNIVIQGNRIKASGNGIKIYNTFLDIPYLIVDGNVFEVGSYPLSYEITGKTIIKRIFSNNKIYSPNNSMVQLTSPQTEGYSGDENIEIIVENNYMNIGYVFAYKWPCDNVYIKINNNHISYFKGIYLYDDTTHIFNAEINGNFGKLIKPMVSNYWIGVDGVQNSIVNIMLNHFLPSSSYPNFRINKVNNSNAKIVTDNNYFPDGYYNSSNGVNGFEEHLGSTRPTLDANNKGFCFYDTTLNKPIWWNGTEWVDATGTPV